VRTILFTSIVEVSPRSRYLVLPSYLFEAYRSRSPPYCKRMDLTVLRKGISGVVHFLTLTGLHTAMLELATPMIWASWCGELDGAVYDAENLNWVRVTQ
jgi:hypothetical protein